MPEWISTRAGMEGAAGSDPLVLSFLERFKVRILG